MKKTIMVLTAVILCGFLTQAWAVNDEFSGSGSSSMPSSNIRIPSFTGSEREAVPASTQPKTIVAQGTKDGVVAGGSYTLTKDYPATVIKNESMGIKVLGDNVMVAEGTQLTVNTVSQDSVSIMNPFDGKVYKLFDLPTKTLTATAADGTRYQFAGMPDAVANGIFGQ